jgi:thiamine-phosphate pyrophosphorylase
MPFNPPKLITYLITNGATTSETESSSEAFYRVLDRVRQAVASGITLVQLREKNLTARVLFELTARAAKITRNSQTRLLVNDRADVARAANADGVHLTSKSLAASVVRRAFGEDFLIGVSTHSLTEASEARDEGADFAVFGPVFDTPSKIIYGAPVRLEQLREAAYALHPFPLIALGGITLENMNLALETGARGIAAIRLFEDADARREVMQRLSERR